MNNQPTAILGYYVVTVIQASCREMIIVKGDIGFLAVCALTVYSEFLLPLVGCYIL